MKRWMAVTVCSLSLAIACSDDNKPGATTGTGGATNAGTGGTAPGDMDAGDAAEGGAPGAGGMTASMMITAAAGGTLTTGSASLHLRPQGMTIIVENNDLPNAPRFTRMPYLCDGGARSENWKGQAAGHMMAPS
jgi:hypothetical protein